MRTEIISIGNELLQGDIVDSNTAWLSGQLTRLGYRVQRQVSIGDDRVDIVGAISGALLRAELVITTGGLGPTSDDITSDAIAGLLGKQRYENKEALSDIEAFFQKRGQEAPVSTRVQAQVPQGAHLLRNGLGTAPGLFFRLEENEVPGPAAGRCLVVLPGPPRELKLMFADRTIPLLLAQFPPRENWHYRILRTTGIGESRAEELVVAALDGTDQNALQVGYCARPGEVDIRLAGCGETGRVQCDRAEAAIRQAIHPFIYGVDDETLEGVVLERLTEQSRTLAIAESCTGGYIAHRITNVAGASAVLAASVVTYSNAAKANVLDVGIDALEKFGAVSEEVARQMANGIKNRFQVDYGLAVTGIAGPGGGSEEKPVGTVFIGLATPNETLVTRRLNPYERETFKAVTSQQALEDLRQAATAPPS